jgi:hypothetical protein
MPDRADLRLSPARASCGLPREATADAYVADEYAPGNRGYASARGDRVRCRAYAHAYLLAKRGVRRMKVLVHAASESGLQRAGSTAASSPGPGTSRAR